MGYTIIITLLEYYTNTESEGKLIVPELFKRQLIPAGLTYLAVGLV